MVSVIPTELPPWIEPGSKEAKEIQMEDKRWEIKTRKEMWAKGGWKQWKKII